MIIADEDGYTIIVNQAKGFVTQAESLLDSARSTIGGLASAIINGTSFAGIGSSVAAANGTLHANLVSGLGQFAQLMTGVAQNVDQVIERYIAADKAVAKGYGGLTGGSTGMATKAGPGNEKLPPFHTAEPTLADRLLKAELENAALPYLGQYQGWHNAAGMFQHYLDGSGTDYQIDPSKLMRDVPSFNREVNDFVAAHRGTVGTFDSGWINTNTDIYDSAHKHVVDQESYDWYYAMHDWRYRVSGRSIDFGDGNIVTDYTVDVYKPYIFGSPRGNINLPGSGHLPFGPYPVLKQDDIEHLNTVGLARNFNVVGSSSFSTDSAPTGP